VKNYVKLYEDFNPNEEKQKIADKRKRLKEKTENRKESIKRAEKAQDPTRVELNKTKLEIYNLDGEVLDKKDEVIDLRVKRIKEKIAKLYAFIRDQQRVDGSWLYSPDGNSFIDCFHSCIVLKNLIKASKFIALDNCEAVIHSGYNYIKQNFLSGNGLARRFSVSNKPSMIRYDLYDSAELMSLSALTGDHELVANLSRNIELSFVRGQDIYSQIDIIGRRRNKNMLRWAVMPYLHALSQLDGEAES